MRIYLVRHGETDLNAQNIYQTPDTPLSKLGLKQAENLAKRFPKLPVDIIIASPYQRAKQTALVISSKIDKRIVFDENLKEIVRPSQFQGKRLDDPFAMKVKKMFIDNENDPNWHYSDEENFHDVKKRAEKFLENLENRTEKHIVVVSHALLMKMLLSVVMFQSSMTALEFNRVYNFFVIKNTGITILDKTDKGFVLVTWNDHAHLG